MQSLTVATFNIQAGAEVTRGYWEYLIRGWRYFLPHAHDDILARIGQFIRSQQVDAIVLNEIDGGSFRTRLQSQLSILSQESGLSYAVFFPTSQARGSNQGNAILSRYPLSNTSHEQLPGSGEARFLSSARLQVGVQHINLFATHLSLSARNRSKQLAAIRAITTARAAQEPLILAGDFNTDSAHEFTALGEAGLFQLHTAHFTYPAWKPKKSLDHLFHSKDIRIHAHVSTNRTLFSDHLPILATVEIG